MNPLYLGTDRVCHAGDVHNTLRLVQALANRTVPDCQARIYRDDWAVPHIIITVPGEDGCPLVLQPGQWFVVGDHGDLRIEGSS